MIKTARIARVVLIALAGAIALNFGLAVGQKLFGHDKEVTPSNPVTVHL